MLRHATGTAIVVLPCFQFFCNVFEMILLMQLEKIVEKKCYFSQLQFGFREGVSCLDASFVVSESINHLIE